MIAQRVCLSCRKHFVAPSSEDWWCSQFCHDTFESQYGKQIQLSEEEMQSVSSGEAVSEAQRAREWIGMQSEKTETIDVPYQAGEYASIAEELEAAVLLLRAARRLQGEEKRATLYLAQGSIGRILERWPCR